MSRRSASAAPQGPVSARGGEPADADLLGVHLQGDPDAFCTLFRRHKEDLWAVAIRMLGDAGGAAGAIQEAMVQAFRKEPESVGGYAVTTWLCRVVVSACLGRMRRSPPASDGHVMAALRRLVVEQQAALVLIDMLSFSVADASTILGVSADTLVSRCDRGRAQLVAELRHDQQSH